MGSAYAFARFMEGSVALYADGVLSEVGESVIAEYSMVGLFALHVLCVTGTFTRCVSASGFHWPPGFADMVFRHLPDNVSGLAYMSLGDRETRTRNPVMATVQDSREKIAPALSRAGIGTIFKLNPDNHFMDAAPRLARGIAWTLSRIQG